MFHLMISPLKRLGTFALNQNSCPTFVINESLSVCLSVCLGSDLIFYTFRPLWAPVTRDSGPCFVITRRRKQQPNIVLYGLTRGIPSEGNCQRKDQMNDDEGQEKGSHTRCVYLKVSLKALSIHPVPQQMKFSALFHLMRQSTCNSNSQIKLRRLFLPFLSLFLLLHSETERKQESLCRSTKGRGTTSKGKWLRNTYQFPIGNKNCLLPRRGSKEEEKKKLEIMLLLLLLVWLPEKDI